MPYGLLKNVSPASSWASACCPSKISWRTLGRACRAAGLSLRYGLPAQTVFSFSWMRSRPGFPYTIAPSRPLPTGRARTHSSPAGSSYQRESASFGWLFPTLHIINNTERTHKKSCIDFILYLLILLVKILTDGFGSVLAL